MFKLDLNKVAETLLKQCDLFNCPTKSAWKNYMHEIITEQYTFEEVEECLKKNNYFGLKEVSEPKYVLRWQRGLINDEVKLYYTYGSINTLREKAKPLANDDKIVFISIDKIEEVIKDTRSKKIMEYIENNTLE